MRRAIVAMAVLVACGVLAGALATGAVAQDETGTIENCTVVDEPGEYELAGDVTTNDSETCIEVRAGDVTIDGNGHAVDGPGADDGTDAAAAGVLVDGTDGNVTVRNVQITGFDVGVQASGADTVEVSEATVMFNGDGLLASGSDVVMDNSSVRANDGNGVEIEADATLTSADSYVNDNGDNGIVAAGDVTLWDDETARNGGYGLLLEDGATADLTWTTVASNGEDGIHVGDADLRMEDVIIKDNAGYELDARAGLSTAEDLDFNQTVITAFEDEAIAAETVDSDELPGRSDNATAAGDGLEVVGSVQGQVEMVFDVETDEDTVEVRRHDGEDWTTVAENVSVNNGTVEYTADASGTFAAVESADEQEDADEGEETDEGDESDSSDDETDDGDEDDSSSGSGSSSTSSGYSGSSTSSGSSGSSSSDRGGPLASTPTPTPTEEPTETESETDEDGASETSDDEHDGDADEDETAEQDDDDDVAAAQEPDEDDTDDEGGSLADGPGFTALAALLALVASAALAQRRR